MATTPYSPHPRTANARGWLVFFEKEKAERRKKHGAGERVFGADELQGPVNVAHPAECFLEPSVGLLLPTYVSASF